jgi:hypothetical protein
VDDSTLYSTIAQVLPLFVLALAAERRFGVHERSTGPTIDAIVGIAFLTSCAIGELGAFAGLTHPSSSNKSAAEIGLGFASLFLFADLIWAQVSAHKAHDRPTAERIAVHVIGTAVIAAGAVLLLLAYLATL